MAKIQSTQIAQQDLFKNIIDSAKALQEQLRSNMVTYSEMVKIQGDLLRTNPFQTPEDLRAFSQAVKELDTAEKGLQATKKAQKTLQDQILSAEQKLAQARTAEARELAKVRAELNKVNKENRDAAKATIEVQGAYAKLSKELNVARNAVKNILAENRALTESEEQLVLRVQQLDAQLKKIDATVGQSQRNVGNYASGFNGLNNSINQITRELPAFTYSMQTGFLAISNNIPILFDELAKIRKANEALIKQGKPAISTFKALAGAVFSFGTALSLGVTVLTLYGAEIVEFVASLFKAEEQAQRTQEEIDRLNEVLQEGADLMANVRSIEDRIKAIDKLSESQKQYLKSDIEAELKANEEKQAALITLNEVAQNRILKRQEELTQKRIALQEEYNNAQTDMERYSVKLRLDSVEALHLTLEKELEGLTSTEVAENIKKLKSWLELIKSKEGASKREKEAIDKINEEVTKEYQSRLALLTQFVELEARKRGDSEIEIARQVLMAKQQFLIEEIEARKEANRTYEDLELELLKTTQVAESNRAEVAKSTMQKRVKDDSELLKLITKNYTDYVEQSIQTLLSAINEVFRALEREDQYQAQLLDRQIQRQNNALQTQQQLAAQGLANTLAFEQQQAAELELKREQIAERQERRAKVQAYYNAFSEYLKENPDTAAGKALAQVALAETLVGFFNEGTESVSGKTNMKWRSTGTDDYLAAVNEGERIVPTKLNKLIGTMSNKELADLAFAYRKGELSTATIIPTFNDGNIVAELRGVQKSITQIQTKIDWDSQGRAIERTVKNGMKKVITHVNSKPRI